MSKKFQTIFFSSNLSRRLTLHSLSMHVNKDFLLQLPPSLSHYRLWWDYKSVVSHLKWPADKKLVCFGVEMNFFFRSFFVFIDKMQQRPGESGKPAIRLVFCWLVPLMFFVSRFGNQLTKVIKVETIRSDW